MHTVETDARLTTARLLEVDESPLTGESLAATKDVAPAAPAAYLLECRSLRTSLFAMPAGGNPWVWAGIAAVSLLQLAFIYAPPLQRVFGSAPLDASGWALAAVAALSVLPIVEVEKRLRRRAR